MIRNRIIHLKICNPSVTTSKFRSPVSVNWCFLGGHLHNIRRATMLKHENIYANIDVFIPLSELSVETLTHFRKKSTFYFPFHFIVIVILLIPVSLFLLFAFQSCLTYCHRYVEKICSQIIQKENMTQWRNVE